MDTETTSAFENSNRISSINWRDVESNLNEMGYGSLGKILTTRECENFIAGYDLDSMYRSRIIMKNYRFGLGEYKYFSYPLPSVVGELRQSLFPYFSGIANSWQEKLNQSKRYPKSHADYLVECVKNGQSRPTPLILKYGDGDYNRLHQDLYGTQIFPIQVVVLLSNPGADFSGGEFILTEQRPRMQSRAEIVPLMQGEAVAFAVNERPVQGVRGIYRAKMRHGVSTVRVNSSRKTASRFALGIIFHDAE